MIVPHSFIYRNSLQAIGDFHSQCYVDCLAAGTISAVYFVAAGVTDFADDWFFGLKVNGANVLLGADRPHITATNLAPFIEGLAIPVNFLDRFSPTIDARATGTINGPITIVIDVDDGVPSGIGDAISDAPYDEALWQGDATHAASKNATRDEIEVLRAAIVSGSLSDGDYTDIVVSGGGAIFTIKSPIVGKAIASRVGTIASSPTPTPNADAHDEFIVTALSEAAAFGAPTGAPSEGQPMIIRVRDNGSPQALGWHASYRAIGVTLPVETIPDKTLYIGQIYNAAEAVWDVLGVNQQA
jgi:hypothetical protein